MSSMRSASSITSRFAAVEQDLAAPEQVHQAARRGDQHVDALFERLDLVAHLNAADQQRHRELVYLPYFSKFSDTCAASSRVGSRISERGIRARLRPWARMSIIGSTKPAVLPVPVWAMPIRSLAHQDRRDRAALDRRRLGIAAVLHGAEQLVRKAEVGKSHAKSG